MPYCENWDSLREIHEAWWRHELDRPLLHVYSPKGNARGAERFDWWSFLRHKDDLDSIRRLLDAFPETEAFHGDAVPSMFINLGAGSLAAYLSGYLSYDTFNQTAWFEDPQSWDTVEAMAFQEDNAWWQYTKDLASLCAEAGKDRFIVGMVDIGGILDVLASLRGAENLLMDLVEAPDRVNAMRARILETWHHVYDTVAGELARVQTGSSSWLRLWCPGHYHPLQCDFSAMISPAMFEAFVAPDVQEQCRRLGHGIYHLDGPNEIPHLDLLLDIPELDGIQWVPGSGNPQCDSPKWYPMYERILDRGKLLLLPCFDDLRNVPRMLEALPKKGIHLTVDVSSEAKAGEFLESVRRVIPM